MRIRVVSLNSLFTSDSVYFVSLSLIDIAHKFAISIAATAKQIELLINSLPAEEASVELQDEATKQLLSDYRKESAKLVHLITQSFQKRLSKVRQLLCQIAETQLLTRALEGEVSFAASWCRYTVICRSCPLHKVFHSVGLRRFQPWKRRSKRYRLRQVNPRPTSTLHGLHTLPSPSSP